MQIAKPPQADDVTKLEFEFGIDIELGLYKKTFETNFWNFLKKRRQPYKNFIMRLYRILFFLLLTLNEYKLYFGTHQ